LPVAAGGKPVQATLLVLNASTDPAEAINMLYRREMHQVGIKAAYDPSAAGKGRLSINELTNRSGIERVLYTGLEANIDSLTPQRLAAVE